jgi:hypothetical protein
MVELVLLGGSLADFPGETEETLLNDVPSRQDTQAG